MTRLLLQPLVDAELVADVLALQDQELLVELLLQLALPLEGEVGRADDQDALGEAAQLQLADEQARHDRLAGAGVVGQQEAHAGELEQVVVDRLELVRQRIDARDREPEVRDRTRRRCRARRPGDRGAAGARRRRRNARASRIVRRSRSSAVSVTLRKRSDCVPTRPTTQLAGPLGCTVSTRIGSLKSGPVRIWPGLRPLTPLIGALHRPSTTTSVRLLRGPLPAPPESIHS